MTKQITPPPRNDFKSKPLQSQPHSLRNREPGYRYEWASLDSEHPGFVEHKLVPQEIGDESIGYTTTPAWEVVKRPTNEAKALQEAGVRADQGKPLDGTYRRGNQVLIRCRESDWEGSYKTVHRLRVEAEEQRLFGGTSDGEKAARIKQGVAEGTVPEKQILEGVR